MRGLRKLELKFGLSLVIGGFVTSFVAAILGFASAVNAGAVAEVGAAAPEVALLTALQAMQGGRSGDALRELKELTQREPNFHLAQLLYGQVLALRSGAAGASPLADDQDPRIRELLDEYHVRVDDAKFAPSSGSLPDAILRLSGSNRYAILADLPHSRLYVLSNTGGSLHVVYDYYSTLARNGYGKQTAGDLRTPVGIYTATGFTPGSALPPLYGAGAFPLNYPNVWDRLHGRTGYGIWLHGVPANTYVRPPRASEGCVVLANQDLLSLKPLIVPDDTPVIFSDKVDWESPTKLAVQRDELEKRIETWRGKWSALDTDAYLGFYANDFTSEDGMNKTAFAEYKHRVNQSKHEIQVKIGNLDLYSYPGEKDLVMAEFTQDYHSDNYSNTERKQQYWQREPDGSWKILREENR